MGRTEGLAFSPDNRRLAVAGYSGNRVFVFDVEIASGSSGSDVTLTGALEISSPALDEPHGLAFIDDATVLVANRAGNVTCLELPVRGASGRRLHLSPVHRELGAGLQLKALSSLSVTHLDERLLEMLFCDSLGDCIVKRVIDRQTGTVVHNEVLVQRYLAVPDGIGVSPDRQWIAVSNHTHHNVLLYRNSASLNRDSEPDALLRGMSYPHGVIFTPDGRHVIVADAGSPDIHVYRRGTDEWRGLQSPLATLRVMDDATFRKGRINPEEGGPKGLAVDADSRVLALTSQCQPLAFLALTTLLDEAASYARDDGPAPTMRDELNAMDEAGRLRALEMAELERYARNRPHLVRFAALVKRRLRARLRGSL